MSRSLNKLIVILGPTASGKTAWAFKLCEEFSAQSGGEIVSADSRQIYKGMDIGTGKIPNYELPARICYVKSVAGGRIMNYEIPLLHKEGTGGGIFQHLINIVNPDETLTVSEYKKMAVDTINDIISREKIPFLVGGTGLYISAIVNNLDIPEIAPNWKLREELENKNLGELRLQLKNIDPGFYEEIDLNNKRRIIRAIEVSMISGKPFSSLRKKGASLFDCLQIGIDVPRKELIERIDKRVNEMKENGLKEEIKNLAQKYSWDLPSMSGIGYKEFAPLLNPLFRESRNLDIFNQIKMHTRQYAKRQMTWFKKDERIIWIRKYEEARKLIANYLDKNCHCQVLDKKK